MQWLQLQSSPSDATQDLHQQIRKIIAMTIRRWGDDDIRESDDSADYNGLSLALSALAKENLQKLSPFFADGEYDGDEDGNAVDNWWWWCWLV